MKINIDLSNSELEHTLSRFKDDARMIVELTSANGNLRNELWKAQDATRTAESARVAANRDAEYWKNEYEYQRTRLEGMSNTIDLLRTELDSHRVNVDDTNAMLFRKMLEAAMLAQSGKKINAIKVVRSVLNMGLKEAKDLVEGAMETYHTAANKENLAGTPPGNTLGDLLKSKCGEGS